LAEGMGLHFVFMWLFFINGFIYVLYLIFSGQWRFIFPDRKSIKESLIVVLHDLHLTKKIPSQKKYNAAQRIAYTLVIFMGLGSVLTGLSIYKPIQFGTLTSMLGGYEWARIEHFTLTILFVLFFLVHILMVIFAGWNNFQSMITGLFVLKDDKEILPPVLIPVGETDTINEIENSEVIPTSKEEIVKEDILPSKDNDGNKEQILKNNPDE
jgi:thiosulfate reductase cytochrome b subunit